MKTKIPNKTPLFVVSIVCFLLAHVLHRPFSDNATRIAEKFEKTLHKKEEQLMKEMLLLAERGKSQTFKQLFLSNPEYYNNLMPEQGLALLIYENDTLKFWSDNSIAVENRIKEVCLDTKFIKLKNGWFEVMRPPTNANSSKTVVGFIKIKNEYPYQNKYLDNTFQHDFSVPEETRISENPNNTGFLIKNTSGDELFYLQINESAEPLSLLQHLAFLLNIIGMVCLILFLKDFLVWFWSPKHTASVLFVISIIVLRYLSILFLFPATFYSYELFSPKIYADAQSVWLNSLGDLLINAFLLLFLTHFLINNARLNVAEKIKRKTIKQMVVFFLFLFLFGVSWQMNTLFIGIIKHSNIPLSVNDLFALNHYSFIAILVIGVLLLVYFLIADKIADVLLAIKHSNKSLLFWFLFSAILHVVIYHLLGTMDLIVIFWPVVLLAFIYLFKTRGQLYSFSTVIFFVFLFSVYAVHVFIKHTGFKEAESRKIFAERIAAEQDPIAELLFKDIVSKIKTDSILVSFVSGQEKQAGEFEKRLKQQYFSGFWDKYDMQSVYFDNMCVPIVKSANATFDSNFNYDEQIAKKGIETGTEQFFSLQNPTGKISYVARINLYKPRQTIKSGTLYIELNAKFVSDETGFPELLLDRNVGMLQQTNVYSYAKYKKGELVNQYGKHKYSFSAQPFASGNEKYERIILDGFDHVVYYPDKETIIVISKHALRFVDRATSFSFLFTFFSILLATLVLLYKAFSGKLLSGFNFKYRIQVLLVFIVLVSLALFGSGTIYYINMQFQNKNRENISEKIHSVLMDVESKIANEENLSPHFAEYSNYILKKLSGVFFTDINLYDTEGNLYASSRTKVFDEGLSSKKMNPEAFKQLSILGRTEFIHDEQIGKLEFLSAYVPLKNTEGKVLAYINLPYFAKQSELEKEISGFLVALINIYVLLFALSIITAILISNFVTRPLKLIQDKLSKIKLGKANETIEWKEKDEIGSLVSEYNRMILELSKSAELLAKSERESAWREMAKQVAHEIKNPLTPMKLSVQHLQRTYKDQAPDMDEKIERLTKTIIEQIDTLSSIATAFSNFAKMPKTNLEKIEISEFIQNTILLFKAAEKVEIKYKNTLKEAMFVMADKEQLLRVLNNLIKNAVQATEEKETPEINILLERENTQVIISVSDNGCGIADDAIDKIFTPNFTTKTAGMGLGLAMVKNIVEGCGGSIRFKTELNKGSTFYVALPCEKE